MEKIIRLLVPTAFFILLSVSAFATHNRAGEIVVQQIGGCTSNTVKVTVNTWTKTSSVAADRDSVTICWGDGTCNVVPRFNGNGEPLANDVKYNTYMAEHTYDGPGVYTVSMTDPNRNGDILNVNPPSSDNVQFHLQTTFTLFSGQSQGCNSTPFLLNAPIDYACIGEPFVHNPGAYDEDGDSLSYELIVPLQDVDTPVPNYIWPPSVNGNEGSSFTINAITGTMEWFNPMTPGEYNVAMIIISWRNGVPMDTTVRDMQILVEDCDDNHAPDINAPDEICVIAGETVQFQVIASDPDFGDKIKLSAQGAPFILDISPANDVELWRPFGSPSAVHEPQPVTKVFRWNTTCEHISDLHYNVVFKAEDDFFLQNVAGSTGLATSHIVRIKVVGPPPQDVQAQPSSTQVKVSWELPYVCEDAEDDFFLSFSVWRKEGDNVTIDNCKPGLDGTGYVHLGNTRTEVDGRYFFLDTDVERGKTYCYRVLARFAKRTETGQAYNIVESLASDNVCVQLSRDVPLITHVSVNETMTANGEIQVQWIKPLAEDLDTLINHGPYRYDLIRNNGFQSGGSNVVASFSAPTYAELTANEFIDQAPDVNTEERPHTYDIAFYVKGEAAPLGFAPSASSVFLEIEPTDNRLNLSWSFDVPWINSSYDIFKWNGSGWDSLTTVLDTFYSDLNLLNGREYCYYIRAVGSYDILGVPAPLINLSQEACAMPVDNVAPCPPELEVTNICDDNHTCEEGEELFNYLVWENPMNICPDFTDDVVSYNIYFAATEGAELELVAQIDDSGITKFDHQPAIGIAGCYAVTALDTFLNESDYSNVFCVDNCPTFSLPNAFTPNGDGKNDFYIPYPFCFIESIELSIYNRWGQLVFETRDPNINWEGINLNGNELPDGTYYYKCRVFEQRVSGTVEAPELLNGYIDLIR